MPIIFRRPAGSQKALGFQWPLLLGTHSSSCLPLIKRQGLPRFQGNDIHIHIPGTYISESRQFLHHLLFGPRSWPSTSNASLLRPASAFPAANEKEVIAIFGLQFSNPTKFLSKSSLRSRVVTEQSRGVLTKQCFFSLEKFHHFSTKKLGK